MAGTIYSGTYTTGINLYNPAMQRPVTVTGKITNASGDAIFGTDAFAWTVDNKGTVDSTGIPGSGIQLLAGGTVNNLVAGSVSPSGLSGAALIAGYDNGVLIEFAPGRVANLGEIEATGTTGAGVNIFAAGGTVINGSATDATALITAGGDGVAVAGVGAVTNLGSIKSTVTGQGVRLDDGGSVANGSAAATAALISSVGTHTAVYIAGGAGAVSNFGAINGGSVGVFLGDGGRVANGRSGSGAGIISSATSSSVSIDGAAGTVANFGVLHTTGTVANVALNGGGIITNGALGATGAMITGTGTGVYINNAAGTVTNFGTIAATSASAGTGVVLEDGGTATNFGTIQNTDPADSGVYFHGGGSLTNGKGALIAGGSTGVSVNGGAGAIVNAGTIKSAAGNGIYLHTGGGVTNQAGGVIAGQTSGVYNRQFAIMVANSGLIETKGTLDGVYLRGGGTLTNNTGATIAGAAAGVAMGQQGGTVTNHGLIKGVVGFAALRSGANTLINFGTVASTVPAGIAVELGNSVGRQKLLVVEKGAVFTGQVLGGGRSEIEFASPGVAAMGANISGFNTVALANGGPDSLTLTNANLAGVDGLLTVIGGNAGKTVAASAVTTGRLTIEGGPGADILTGSANGLTTFIFSVTNLTAADKVAGGGGFNNELDMTTAGTIAAGNVSAVEIYRLANGGPNTLTLSNANFTGFMGNAITVYGGAGGNTIDGSKLSVAADRLVIYGGSGADVLKGGAGNDVFSFSAPALTATDIVNGGGGENELLMTSAGTVHANEVSAVETYVLADGGKNALTLGVGNFAGTGGTITVSGGNGGNTVTLAAGLPAADRLVAYAGSGLDNLTGGAGNDVFYAGGNTVMTGKAGTNEFVFTGIGNNTITDFGATGSNDEIVFSNSGFNLGLSGATATPKPLPPGLFVADAAGTFTASSQRFAYGTTTGKLYYSAFGTTPTERLVATLAGAPSLTAAHLFFIT